VNLAKAELQHLWELLVFEEVGMVVVGHDTLAGKVDPALIRQKIAKALLQKQDPPIDRLLSVCTESSEFYL